MAEWINNIKRELEGLEEGPKAEIHIDLFKTTLKYIKVENDRLWWNTTLLVQEFHLYSRQTSSKKEYMPRKSTHTRMDDQMKYLLDLKWPIKETVRNNYRPITCLRMIWKI